jgi:hypothetical protein
MRYAILFIALIGLSCGLVKPQIVYINKDSIITNTITVVKDSLITVPGDTINWSVQCLTDTVFIIEKPRSSTIVKVSKGKVSVKTNCKEKDIIITRLQEQLKHSELMATDSVITKTERIKYIPGIYKFYGYGFYTLLAIIATFAIVNKSTYAMIATFIAGAIVSLKKKKSGK